MIPHVNGQMKPGGSIPAELQWFDDAFGQFVKGDRASQRDPHDDNLLHQSTLPDSLSLEGYKLCSSVSGRLSDRKAAIDIKSRDTPASLQAPGVVRQAISLRKVDSEASGPGTTHRLHVLAACDDAPADASPHSQATSRPHTGASVLPASRGNQKLQHVAIRQRRLHMTCCLLGAAPKRGAWAPSSVLRSSFAIMHNIAVAAAACAPPLPGPALLPPKFPYDRQRATLVLDLDETLVHASVVRDMEHHGEIEYTFKSNGELHRAVASVRPGAAAFLEIMAEYFEVVVFTAAHRVYAEPVIDHLDPAGAIIRHRLFRSACRKFPGGACCKDLSTLGRDLSRVVLVDDNPVMFSLQPDNGVPVSSWHGSGSDRALMELVPLLCHLADVPDVRIMLRSAFNVRAYIATANKFSA